MHETLVAKILFLTWISCYLKKSNYFLPQRCYAWLNPKNGPILLKDWNHLWPTSFLDLSAIQWAVWALIWEQNRHQQYVNSYVWIWKKIFVYLWSNPYKSQQCINFGLCTFPLVLVFSLILIQTGLFMVKQSVMGRLMRWLGELNCCCHQDNSNWCDSRTQPLSVVPDLFSVIQWLQIALCEASWYFFLRS